MLPDEQIVKFLDKVEKKIDSLDSRLDSVDKTLIKQEGNLGEHMRRTELAERGIIGLREDVDPMKKKWDRVEGAFKMLGVLATLIGVAAGIVKILQYFAH